MADTLEEVCDRILGNRPQIAPFGALDASLLLDFEQVEREASNAAPKDLIASLGDIKHRITPARFTVSGEPSMTEIEAGGPPPSSRQVRRKPVLQSLAPDEINLLSQFSVRNPTMSAFMEAQRNNAKQTGKSGTSHSKVAVSFTGAQQQQQQQQTPLDASSVPQRPQLSDELRKELAEQRKILMQLHHYQTGRVPSFALEGQRTAVLQAIERCATEEDVRKLETRLHSVNRHYDSQLGSASAALVEANNALRLERLRMEDERRQWRRERTVMASEQARRAAERLQQVEAQATLQSAEVASRSMKLVLRLEKDREELAKQAKLQWNAANTWQHPTSGNNTTSSKAIVPVSSVYVAPVPKAAQPKPKPKSLSSTVVEEIPAASAPPPTATASFKPSSAAAIAVYSEAPSRALNLPKGRMGKSAGPRRKPTQQPSPGGAVPVLAQSPAAYPKEPVPEIEATNSEPKGEGTGGQIVEGESPAVWESVGPAVPTVASDPIKEPAEAPPAVIINMPYRSDMDAVRQDRTDDSDHRLLVSALSAATPLQGKVEADAEPAAFLTPDSDLQTAFHEYRRRERRIRELYGVVEDDAFDKQDSTMQAVVRGVVHELIADDVREALGGNTEEDQQWATLVQECLLEHVNVHGTPAQTAMSLAALRSAEATRREHQGVVPTANFYATKTLKANSTKPLSTEPEQVEEDSVLSMLRALLDGPMKVPTMDNKHQPVVTCSEPSREHVTPAVQETQATKLPHVDMPERDTLQASPSTHNRESWMKEERTRDGEKGPLHGMHSGASWANQGGARANYSTRDFYRPYTPSAGGSGFTEEELNEARLQTRNYILYRVTKKLVLFGLVWYAIYVYYLEDRISLAKEAQRSPEGAAAYLAKRADDIKTGKNEPALTPYFDRKMKEVDEQMAANEKRRKELGLKSPFQSDPTAGKATAVSFRGRPFTPEGLAAMRRDKRGISPTPDDLYNGDVEECDMDD